MQAALFDGKTLELTNYSLRKPAVDEVLIKVSACGVCGTDIKIIAGKSGATPPVVLGHEFCGIVEEVGDRVNSISTGDFVSVDPNIFCGECQYCRAGKVNLCENLTALGVDIDGGFAGYSIVPAKQCYPLPPKLPPQQAVLLEPLSCAIYGFQRAKIETGDAVVIFGAGIIGLIMLKLAKLSAVRQIIVVEPDKIRRESSLQNGADFVFDPQTAEYSAEINKITGGGGNAVIECVGSAKVVEQAYRLVKPGGRLVIFGVSPADRSWTVKPYDIFRKDISIVGSFLNPFTFKTAVELVCSGKIQLNDLDIKSFALRDIQKAFENQQRRNSLKTIIDMSI